MMRSRRWLLRLALGPLLVTSQVVTSAAVATPFHFKEFAQGAVVSWTTCPEPPAAAKVGHDYTVYYGRFASTAGEGAVGSVHHAKQPFEAQYQDLEYVIGPDGEGADLAVTYGSTSAVAGYYDSVHLTRAGMGAVSIALQHVDLETGTETSTGESVELGAFRWVARSSVYRFGNNGPLFDERHVSDRCRTTNSHAHQVFTLGSVTGTVNGTPLAHLHPLPQVPDLDAHAVGGIFNNHFRITDVTKHC